MNIKMFQKTVLMCFGLFVDVAIQWPQKKLFKRWRHHAVFTLEIVNWVIVISGKTESLILCKPFFF